MTGLIELFTANPETAVITAYSIAGILVFTNMADFLDEFINLFPVIDTFNLAGVIVVGASLLYHFIVISPANGIQNLFLLLTSAVGISVFTIVLGRTVFKELIG